VLLVPAHTAPYKAAGAGTPSVADPGPEHRLRMCQLAVAEQQGLDVCAVEIERGGLSYTVDTLKSIHASHPSAQLTFILGADTASTLDTWRRSSQLLELAQLAVATRAGSARQQVLDALARIEDANAHTGATATATDANAAPGASVSARVPVRVSFLEMPAVEVSSSLARQRVAAGEAIDDLVGPAVAAYIAEHQLYASAAVKP
jgi:nicotinate-nucleotide adenylyltransferase